MLGSFALYFWEDLPIFWMSLVPKEEGNYKIIFILFLMYGSFGFILIAVVCGLFLICLIFMAGKKKLIDIYSFDKFVTFRQPEILKNTTTLL